MPAAVRRAARVWRSMPRGMWNSNSHPKKRFPSPTRLGALNWAIDRRSSSRRAWMAARPPRHSARVRTRRPSSWARGTRALNSARIWPWVGWRGIWLLSLWVGVALDLPPFIRRSRRKVKKEKENIFSFFAPFPGFHSTYAREGQGTGVQDPRPALAGGRSQLTHGAHSVLHFTPSLS